jgi:hypothetical protein
LVICIVVSDDYWACLLWQVGTGQGLEGELHFFLFHTSAVVENAFLLLDDQTDVRRITGFQQNQIKSHQK